MSGGRIRGRLAWVVAVTAAVGAFLAIGAGNALAFSCTVVNGDDVLLTMVNETVTLSKGNLSSTNANGVGCNGQTASNTETIFVSVNNVASANQGANLIVDMGGGRFEPGAATEGALAGDQEGTGLNEIEIVIINADAALPNGNTEYLDSLTILGNAAADSIQIGNGFDVSCDDGGDGAEAAPTDATLESGIVNLNGDDDADICLADAGATLGQIGTDEDEDNNIIIRGLGGNDTLSGKGGKGTGPPADPDDGLTIDGGDGDDSIQGGEDDDLLLGGPGNDVIDGDDDDLVDPCEVGINVATGTADAEDLDGDTVVFATATGPITADLDPGEGHPGTATGEGTDVLQNVENIIGSPANDVLSGDNSSNQILGLGGDDTIAGDAGDDCELGGDGNDTFDQNEGTSIAQGGTGTDNGADEIFGNSGADDTITYSSRTTRVNVLLEPLFGGATRPALGGFDACDGDNIERAALGVFISAPDGADLDGDGFSGDDEADCVFLDTENVITGSGNDLISGAFPNNRADNEITANAGNDLMDGGAGNDTFHEGSAANGADDMDGGTGGDTCDYSLRTNPVSVNLDGADNDGEAGEGDNCGGVVDTFFFAIQQRRQTQGRGFDEGDPIAGQDVELVLGGSGNDNLTGSDQANVLTGNAGNDTLTGNGGTDVLNGGDGDDWMIPGAGNDTAAGGAGTDTVDYASAGAGGVGVNVNLTAGQASGEGNDTISDTENASGSSFADSIHGTSGANVLNGRGDDDAIQAGDGDDSANGGSGRDVLSGNGGNDRISGGVGADTIRGGSGDDNLGGGPDADTIYGGAGNDILSGGAGPDDHRGGPGTDRCNPGSPGLGNGDTAVGCES